MGVGIPRRIMPFGWVTNTGVGCGHQNNGGEHRFMIIGVCCCCCMGAGGVERLGTKRDEGVVGVRGEEEESTGRGVADAVT